MVHHLDDRPHPVAFRPDHRSEGPVILDLRRRIRPVAGLSFSRIKCSPFRSPAGDQRGTRKQLSPPGACASVRNASDIGAEQNHLCPTSRHPAPSGTARVALARTSDPPCFSVIAMPAVTPAFSPAGRLSAS